MGYHLRAEAAAGPREEGRATRGACTTRAGVGSGYRYYSTELGRWVNRDPIGERGGLHLLSIAANDPVSRYDILGLIILPGNLSAEQRQAIQRDLTNARAGYFGAAAKELARWAMTVPDVFITFRSETVEDAREVVGRFPPAAALSSADPARLFSDPLSDDNFRNTGHLTVVLIPRLLGHIYARHAEGSDTRGSSIYAEPVLHELLHAWAAYVITCEVNPRDYPNIHRIFRNRNLTLQEWRSTHGYEETVSEWSTRLRGEIYR